MTAGGTKDSGPADTGFSVPPAGFTTRPELSGTFGMVASTHWIASAAGMALLEAGGNAFDAAAAAAFVLHVVEPHLNGPGGEVPAVFATAADPTPRVLCGQGTAPAAATIEHYRGLGLDLVPGTGHLAATVPGAVGAWLMLLKDHGTRPLRDVLDAAIGYAEHGHPVLARVSQTIASSEQLFRKHWTTSAEQWLPGGRVPEAGELVRNPALAETYKRLVQAAEAAGPEREEQYEAAHRAWYGGFVAEAIEAFVRIPARDESGHDHVGVLTAADLAAWRPSYESPATYDWRGVTVCKAGAWSQGPVLLEQLALLDALGELPEEGSAELIHRVVEAAKLAFADREAWYGDDPDVPLEALLSKEYAAERAELITDQASYELRPGAPDGRAPRLPAQAQAGAPGQDGSLPGVGEQAIPGLGEPTLGRPGEPTVRRGDTCHVDVVDRWGNIISATPSGGWLQSAPCIPGLGFCLGTRAQMFWLEDGLPNSLAPGKRPRTTLSPTLLLKDGEPAVACGTPGGDQQDQWQLCLLLSHLAHGRDLQAAVDSPAWHTTSFPPSFAPRAWEPGEVVVESRVGAAVIADLEARGHRVTVSGPWSQGRLSAVSRDPRTGVLRAAANPRGMQGYAVGR
jgi:gamma-glutamyltranspeptidase/glutathione hydrolase